MNVHVHIESGHVMNTTLWVVQVILAIAFAGSGMMKATLSAAAIKQKGDGRMDWVDDVSAGQLRAIGIIEVIGGIGLVLPAAVGILPILTPLAAVGLALTMVGAAVLHLKRSDGAMALAPNVMLGGLAVFVAVQRFGDYAI
ncbi:MAG: putative membrane protein YphA (DoxX/SURF4 family) [Nitriliruptoraceae bacterium]|jgi:uncharacterized membrane protein YphA (DoxX/SURF4 family)